MTRESSPIVEFIRARIDEDEMGAVAATRGPWTWTAPRGYPQRVSNSRAVLIAETYTSPTAPAYDIEHIVRHDPNRVFREVAAKRRLLAEYEDTVRWYDQHKTAPAGEVHGLWKAVRLLAEPYSDHPEYASVVGTVGA